MKAALVLLWITALAKARPLHFGELQQEESQGPLLGVIHSGSLLRGVPPVLPVSGPLNTPNRHHNIHNRQPEREAIVLRHDRMEPGAGGSSGVSYETSNGIKVEEKTQPDQEGFNTISGSYSYTTPEGILVNVQYVADREGFTVKMPPLPGTPPHALEQIRRGEELHRRAAEQRARLRDLMRLQ